MCSIASRIPSRRWRSVFRKLSRMKSRARSISRSAMPWVRKKRGRSKRWRGCRKRLCRDRTSREILQLIVTMTAEMMGSKICSLMLLDEKGRTQNRSHPKFERGLSQQGSGSRSRQRIRPRVILEKNRRHPDVSERPAIFVSGHCEKRQFKTLCWLFR